MFLSVGVFAVLCAAWYAVAPRMPEVARPPVEDTGRLYWPADGGDPVHCKGDLESSELLFVGASRVHYGVYLDDFENAAVLWGGGADLLQLLPELERLTPRRLVVELTPLNVFQPRSPLGAELRAVRRPVPGAADFEEELLEWAQAARDLLLERGKPQAQVDAFIGQWFSLQRQEHLRLRFSTENVDRALADRWTLAREKVVRTVTTHPWHDAWFDVLDEERFVDTYRFRLSPETRPKREQILVTVQGMLAELQAKGWKISCVRYPCSEAVLAVELEAMPRGRLERLCEELGVPYFDYSQATDEYLTYDGTHLTYTSGRRFSRTLARDLAAAGF